MMSGRTCLPKIRYQLFYLLFKLSALLLSSFSLCFSPSSLEETYCFLDADYCVCGFCLGFKVKGIYLAFLGCSVSVGVWVLLGRSGAWSHVGCV